MLAGPIFSRQCLIAPRRLQHYLLRAGYVAALFVLMYTAGQATFGWQQVRNIGDIARFGSFVFQIFSLVQLSLVLFFALLLAAGNIAQEKDRGTLLLLLMTDMRDRELVLGKLFASLLSVGVLLAVSVPVFLMVHLLGGVGVDQIGWMIAVTAAAAFAAGSWGSLAAFWREKTFQTLSISVIGLVLFLGAVELLVFAGGESGFGRTVALLNPYRAMLELLSPLSSWHSLEPVHVNAFGSVLALCILALVLNGVAVLRLRVWNPTRSVFLQAAKPGAETTAASKEIHRPIWNSPVIWREIRTRAYGRKIALIKAAYVLIAAIVALAMFRNGVGGEELVLGMISANGFGFAGLSLISLMLINAQAVTAITSERDMKTLELLLVTDISAREFMFGKLGGIIYNTKELVLIPLGLAAYSTLTGQLSAESLLYVSLSFLTLAAFSAVLGAHCGLNYENSRVAIATSLGTLFFLFIGIFIFLMLLVEASSSFFLQFQSFIVFIGVGSICLYVALTHRNASPALTLASGLLPFLTFYALTQFLLDGSLGVCLSICVAYGFTVLAMMIPAVSEFDVALGRTTADQG